MEEDISIILKPLRKLVLNENFIESRKYAFLLGHVHTFITVEKRIALKSWKKKAKQHKKLKENSAAPENKNKSEEVTENNASLPPTEEEVVFANIAVHDWEETTSDLIHLIQEEEKGQQVLDSLVAASKLNVSYKQGIVLCLVILIKKSTDMNIIAKAYSAVAQICKSSRLFLLFLEVCKIYTAANTKNSGWGRGMKRAIRNWYMQWEPKNLALEVIRCPSAFTWSHKDVLKMAHINIKDLPTGTGVVLNFIFSGFESTKEKYKSEENAKDLVQLLEILHKGTSETNSEALVEREKNILSKFGSISLSDFSTQALNDVKVMSFLLENGSPQLIVEALASTSLFKLITSNTELRELLLKQVTKDGFCQEVDMIKTIIAYNNCRRISADLVSNETKTYVVPCALSEIGWKLSPGFDAPKDKQWRKNASPNLEKTKKVRSATQRSKEVDEVFAALSKLITERTKDIAITNKILVFVEMDSFVDLFIAVSPEDPISKEVRGTQAISFLILSLISSDVSLESVAPFLAQKLRKSEGSRLPNTFSSLQSSLCKLAKTETDPIDVEECLKASVESKASTCLFVYFAIANEVFIKGIYDKFLEMKNTASELRIVVCVLDSGTIPDVSPFKHPDVLFLFGFNRSVLPVITAFSSGLL